MRRICHHCHGWIEWISCPTGGWWAHETHPDDNHDAEPGRCILHGTELAFEKGGPTMPTLRGRLYCSECEEKFLHALDILDRPAA